LLRHSKWLLVFYYVLGLLVTQIKEAYFKSLWFEISIMIKCVGRVTDQNVIWLGILVTSLNIRMNNSSDIVLANTTSNQFWEHTHTHTHTK